MPQLGIGKQLHAILGSIHREVDPHAVCPILPFPASNPRLGDELIWEFHQEFQNEWKTDGRDLIYAHENKPLDLYRTILRIHAARHRTFRDVGGSQTILSPLGRKMLAVGSLMAALDGNFPVICVESMGFDVDLGRLETLQSSERGELVHVWLAGEAYSVTESREAVIQ